MSSALLNSDFRWHTVCHQIIPKDERFVVCTFLSPFLFFLPSVFSYAFKNFVLNFYLFEKQIQREIFHPWVHSPSAGAEAGQSQEAGTISRSPLWLLETQVLEASSAGSQYAHKQEAGLEVEVELDLRHSYEMLVQSGSLSTVLSAHP